MTVIRMPPPGSLDRISDERLRAAARRFESETGDRLADQFRPPADEGVLGVYLIMRGYSLDDDSAPPVGHTTARD